MPRPIKENKKTNTENSLTWRNKNIEQYKEYQKVYHKSIKRNIKKNILKIIIY